MSRSSTSISNRATLLAVIRRALLFLAPVLLVGGFGEYVLWRTRDCWPASWVVATWQKDPQAIYGPRFFTTNIAWIKGAMIRQRHPQIVALGSSRVTQFRAPMFGPHADEFYNAGHLVTSAAELERMAGLFARGELPRPAVMIVGLDPWWMKITADEAQPETTASRDTEVSPSISAAAHLEALRLFFAKPHFPPALIWPGSPVVEPGSGRRAIGLGALAGNGYRQDGSVLQSNVLEDYLRTRQYRDRETPPVIERIRGHSHQFATTPGLDWKQADRIIAALRMLRAAGTEVYVVLPPFSTEADAALAADPALSQWYAEYRQDLPKRLSAEGFTCANVRTPADYGMADEAMMDGFHPGDVLITRILETLVQQAPPGGLLASVPLDDLRKLREAPGVVPVALDPPARKP